MVPLSAGQVVLFVVSLVIMLWLSPLLTVMALLVVPAVVLVTRATRTVLFPATWAAQQSAAEVAEIVEEDVTGRPGGQGLRPGGPRTRPAPGGRPPAVLEPDAGGAADREDQPRRCRRLTALGQVGVLALGGYLALIGNISLGTFLAFTLYLAQLVAPTRMLTLLLVLGQQARASVERVLEIIDSLPVITERADPVPVPAGPLQIEFGGVRFGYSADDPVLDGFDLTVAAGFDGRAGRARPDPGKSTVSLLLPRFYDPQLGVGQGRRDRCPRPRHERSAGGGRGGVRGGVPVLRLHRRQHRLRPAGRHRRGDPGRRGRRRGRRFHRGVARRVRHGDR